MGTENGRASKVHATSEMADITQWQTKMDFEKNGAANTAVVGSNCTNGKEVAAMLDLRVISYYNTFSMWR